MIHPAIAGSVARLRISNQSNKMIWVAIAAVYVPSILYLVYAYLTAPEIEDDSFDSDNQRRG